MDMMFEIREYIEGRRSPFGEWFARLDHAAAARVDRCIRRLEAGNFGAAKALRGGVNELRLNFGPGYRVYYGFDEKSLHRMLSGRGNPTLRSLAAIVRAIREDIGFRPRVTVAA